MRRKPTPYLLVFLVLQVGVYMAVLGAVRPDTSGRQLSLDRFYAGLQAGNVQRVTYLDFDARATGLLDDGRRFWVALPHGELAASQLTAALANGGVVTFTDQQPTKRLLSFVAQFLLPVLLFFTLFGLLFALFLGGAGGIALFGRSRARRYDDRSEDRITFANVAGLEEAIAELNDVKEFLVEPERFTAMGARPPKGVLLMGPPGVGKTLLARAVAGEAGVPFFSVSGSAFVEMLVGVGASRVRDLFTTARQNAPAIVFIDEIDAVGRARATGQIANEEREQTLNELLVQMDGFGPSAGIVVLTATNRPDLLDDALTRPGRFDRHVAVDLPDIRGRAAILSVHLKGKPFENRVDVDGIARRTPGFSGADLAKVVNEAAILAARQRRPSIGLADIDEGIERVVRGIERSRLLNAGDRRTVAVHEAAHALVAWVLPGSDPIEKVSIVARGTSLGSTRTVPAEDTVLTTRSRCSDRLSVLLAGRVAEVLVFGEPSNGAADDLRSATELAWSMVADWGMSDAVPPLRYQRPGGMSPGRAESPHVADEVERAVAALVDEAETRAREVLTGRRPMLDRLARALESRETLHGDEIEAVLVDSWPRDHPEETSSVR